ncbi:hypothetical protein AMAG_02596 [Allomyces macrogynus ATCC 38327]|uniref:Uncharacterized protein n=1 Tax=Allomyces macrogynus (strain ATCC 38327) TaxID=578462 RepID=A0A0L0S2L3_ALLM3|nr:Outer dense fiber protein 3B [Allomyces javanicus]KAJ3358603.1 Outer dense fiber protein 3B [Allomyces javanicus]KNE56822.1 hypothetical protein AMAG_02596 [Allomyces macrogynus ATCC 38327]|eukprot:KNE56822.1 hypothetical protein AMAG_02596 [Allomyces macrogynus ATCC 38327]
MGEDKQPKSASAPASPSAAPGTVLPEVDGIPIAAKFKGPGPVYSLPPTIGIDAKYIGQRAPAFSFGVKIPLKDASIGPGPAASKPQVPGKGPSFSLQSGFKKTRHDGRAVIFMADPYAEVDLDNPGPAKYKVTATNSVVPRAPAYTITSRPPEEKPAATPGPAAYRPPTSVGTKQITVQSSPAPTIAPARTLKMENKSPGPAAYQPVSPVKVSHAPPAYSLGRRWDKDSELTQAKRIPGPGAYNPTLKTKSAAPTYSFRQRHSEYEHFVADLESGSGPLIL